MNSSNGKPKTIKRRDFIYVATGSVAVVGGLAAIWPLIDSMNPSADILALSAVEVDFSSIEVGQRITVVWRSQPVFIARRTPDEIRMAREDDTADLRDPETDSERVQQPEWLIVIGICTHLGCVPLGQNSSRDRGNWFGWFCPCHGSHYDTSGRIRKGPAPRNLDVPTYAFIGNDKIMLGGTQETAS